MPAGGAQGLPQLLQGALADITICVLGGGYFTGHSTFVAGMPPTEPGFEPLLVLTMQKPAARKPSADAIAAAAAIDTCCPIKMRTSPANPVGWRRMRGGP